MKKLLLTTALLLASVVCSYAEKKEVDLTIKDSNRNYLGHSHTRSPILYPDVTIEDNILSFSPSCINCTIQLIQDDITVYMDYVNENGEVILPTYLSGTYILQFQLGSITFVGEIEL